MTAAERLVALAKTGGTAATLLLLIGSGATAGDALVNYSGLASATAAEHLLVDTVVIEPPGPVAKVAEGGQSPIRRTGVFRPLSGGDRDDDFLMLIL